MKTIPETFIRKGFEHSQIWRNGLVCVYARKAVSGTVTHFETVVLKADKGGKIESINPKTGEANSYEIEPGERYPSSEAWGQRGWTYPDRDAAVAKAESLADTNSR